MKAQTPYYAIWALPFLAAAALAQVELTDNLSVSGFVDAAYTNTDDGTTSSENLALDEAEVDFLFSLDTVSGEVHLQTAGDNIELEQAFVTYDLGNGVAISAGRYLSLLGFETDEKVNRYTRSYSYDLSSPIPLYNDGIKLEAVSDQGWLAISLLEEVWDGFGPGNIDDGALGLEIQAGFTGQQGFTAVVGYGGQDTGDTKANAEIFNVWVSYESGPLILAAEYNDFSNAGREGNTGDSMMVLARYAINEKTSITGRYSEENLDSGGGEAQKWTVAPHYSFTDNLAGRIEFSRIDYTNNPSGKEEVDYLAVEAMFTF